jgi:DNA repair protein RecO (recombination protein O)
VQAIILKKHQFAESNEVITLFSREAGKLRAVAKASKSAKSKLAFGLQPLFKVEIDLAAGKNMQTVTGVKVLQAYAGIRESSTKIAAALSACEFVMKATADEHANQELFDLLDSYLDYLSERAGENTNKSLWKFIFLALGSLGFAAQMQDCVICHSPIPPGNSHFSFRLGGLVCDNCVSRAAADAVNISAEARNFFAADLPSHPTQSNNIFTTADSHPVLENQVRAIAENYSTHILERELKAPRFL